MMFMPLAYRDLCAVFDKIDIKHLNSADVYAAVKFEIESNRLFVEKEAPYPSNNTQTSSVLVKTVELMRTLLDAGQAMKTALEKQQVALSAELFVRVSEATQRVFIVRAFGRLLPGSTDPDPIGRRLAVVFRKAVVSNHEVHQKMEAEKEGSSALTKVELAVEKQWSDYFTRHRPL